MRTGPLVPEGPQARAAAAGGARLLRGPDPYRDRFEAVPAARHRQEPSAQGSDPSAELPGSSAVMTADSHDAHDLAGAFAVDALTREEREAFRRHLADCADCAHETLRQQEAAGWLALAAARTPPPRLKERVLAEVARTPQLPPKPPVRRAAAASDDPHRRCCISHWPPAWPRPPRSAVWRPGSTRRRRRHARRPGARPPTSAGSSRLPTPPSSRRTWTTADPAPWRFHVT